VGVKITAPQRPGGSKYRGDELIEVHCDFETRSTVDIMDAGADVYARHSSTDALCMAWSIDQSPINLWKRNDPCPDEFFYAIKQGLLYAHNAPFELAIFCHVMHRKYGWPEVDYKNSRCTMAMAYAMSLPGKLEQVALALGTDVTKDMDGHRIMLQLSQPRKINPDGSIVWWEENVVPDKFEKLYQYCINDVEVERAVKKKMVPLSRKEQTLWTIDYEINQRGVKVDLPSAITALEIIELEKERLDTEIQRLTGGAVASCGSVKQLTEYLKKNGVDMPSLAKSDVMEVLSDTSISMACREVLNLRQSGSKSSTAKLKKMIEGACDDERMRGLFQFSAAGTRRWAGRRVQLQNLPRPTLKPDAIDHIFSIIKNKKDAHALIEMFYGSPAQAISDCLRGFLISDLGKDLIVCDFSSIEARVLAWLAGQEQTLEIFRTHGKIYEAAAADIFKIPIDQVTKEQRQLGKVAVLALGYQGGRAAFQSMAKAYNVVIPDEQANFIKDMWRFVNKETVQFWYDLERAASCAIRYPGKQYTVNKKIKYLMNVDPKDQFIHIWREFENITLPSSWRVWPHSESKGWMDVIEQTIKYE